MFTTRPQLLGTYGMVASTHWLASQSGMAVLEAGGNAFDAAVAAGFVLQVVEPHLNGPGGEVPVITRDVAAGRIEVLCGQGPAPRGATIARYRELGLDLVPGTGLLAACVPGAVDAWLRLLAEKGTARLRDVLGYAIGYAEGGFPVLPSILGAIRRMVATFEADWPSSGATWLPGGAPPRVGTLVRNPALAATYRRLLAEAEAASGDRDAQIAAARDAWYQGFVAEAIEAFASSTDVLDSSGRRHRGVITAGDLAAYEAVFEDPVTLDYHGYTVCKAGPWSQGPVFLQQLALLEGFDLAGMGLGSVDYVHTVTECAKLAFADREAYYGDPAFADVPLGTLLDAGYAASRRALVGERASLELRPGSPDGRRPRLPAVPDVEVEAPGAGEQTIAGPPHGDTCHVDVVDRHGNMVAATPSGGWLQSSPTIPALGFCLGTRAQMFWLDEGLPGSLEPGKRPRTTLSPSFALRDGDPYLAFGTPGGDQQDQWTLLFFLAHVHFGLDLQAAIDAPAFHSAHFPSSFYPRRAEPGGLHAEGRFSSEVVEGLRARGHDVVVEDDWSLGRVSAVAREPALGLFKAAANPRGMQGYAVGR